MGNYRSIWTPDEVITWINVFIELKTKSASQQKEWQPELTLELIRQLGTFLEERRKE